MLQLILKQILNMPVRDSHHNFYSFMQILFKREGPVSMMNKNVKLTII